MKLLSAILSLYITCLALVPCSDSEHIESSREVQVGTAHNHESSSDCEDDSCTPFCVCSCCQANVTIGEKIVLKHIEMFSFSNLIIDSYSDMVSFPCPEPLFHPPIA